MTGDHCPCIAINHGHKPKHCDEPEAPTGGICATCRFAKSPPGKAAKDRG